MRGKSKYKKHIVKPELKYNSALAAKFINYAMSNGKKRLAEAIVYGALETAAAKLKAEPTTLLDQAIENAKPLLEVKPRRIGGATYLVPMEVKPDRGITLALKAMIASARKKQGKPMAHFLSQELLDAYNGTGEAVARRSELHKLAEANKAFAHFAKY